MPGISSGANSTSTTGPMTRTTRPVPPSVGPSVWVFSMVAVMCFCSLSCRGQRLGATHDLHDFLRDLCLARGVGGAGVALHQLVRVVTGGLHRTPAGRRLGRGRLEQCVPDPALHVTRQQRIEDSLGRRL